MIIERPEVARRLVAVDSCVCSDMATMSPKSKDRFVWCIAYSFSDRDRLYFVGVSSKTTICFDKISLEILLLHFENVAK